MREPEARADLLDADRVEPGSAAAANLVTAEAYAGTNMSGVLASVTEKHRDGIIGMSGLRPDRAIHFTAVHVDLDDVAGVQARLLRLVGTDQHGVVPAQIRD